MKNKSDPRHKARIETMKALFENSFRPNYHPSKTPQATQILKFKNQIDKLISENAPTWPLEQISPLDLATLRLAIWELKFKKKKEPYKVIIDEAVEITKQYGSQSSASFINGVLGAIVKSETKN